MSRCPSLPFFGTRYAAVLVARRRLASSLSILVGRRPAFGRLATRPAVFRMGGDGRGSACICPRVARFPLYAFFRFGVAIEEFAKEPHSGLLYLIGRLNVGQGGLVPRGWSRRGATRFRNRLACRAPMAPRLERRVSAVPSEAVDICGTKGGERRSFATNLHKGRHHERHHLPRGIDRDHHVYPVLPRTALNP